MLLLDFNRIFHEINHPAIGVPPLPAGWRFWGLLRWRRLCAQLPYGWAVQMPCWCWPMAWRRKVGFLKSRVGIGGWFKSWVSIYGMAFLHIPAWLYLMYFDVLSESFLPKLLSCMWCQVRLGLAWNSSSVAFFQVMVDGFILDRLKVERWIAQRLCCGRILQLTRTSL